MFYRLCTSKLKLKPFQVTVVGESILTISPDINKHGHALNFALQVLAQQVPHVVIKGLNHVSRAVIACDDTKTPNRYDKHPSIKMCRSFIGKWSSSRLSAETIFIFNLFNVFVQVQTLCGGRWAERCHGNIWCQRK